MLLVKKTKSTFLRTVVHILGLCAALTYGNKCGPSEYLSTAGECCPMCNIGSVVYRDCTGDYSTTCIPCSKGTFMNEPNGLGKCFQCKACDKVQGLYVLHECTTIHNTVCEILDGYNCKDYSNNQCVFATQHKKCNPGQNIKAPGTKTLDTVCEDCPHGFYSPFGVKCTKWTDCSVNNTFQDGEGSSVKDVRCIPRPTPRYGLTALALFLIILLLLCWRYLKHGKLKTPVEETNASSLANTTVNIAEENKEEETCSN